MFNLIRNSTLQILRAWNQFWFESNQPAAMRVFRITVGFCLFSLYFVRSFDLHLYFGGNAAIQYPMSEMLPGVFRPSLFQYFTSFSSIFAFHLVLLGALLALTLGFYPRLMSFIALVIHLSFVRKNFGVIYGVDLMSNFLLLYLCFADYRDNVKRGSDFTSLIGSVIYRLAQLQLCIVYLFSGLEKVRGGEWWRGEALWSILSNYEMARWDFSWLAHYPGLLTLATFLTWGWELYFPVLIWVKPMRYPMLIFGVLLHVMIGISINLPFFGALMIVCYSVFLNNNHALAAEQWVLKKCRGFKIKPQVTPPVSDRNYV